jgi:hypothetical protein
MLVRGKFRTWMNIADTALYVSHAVPFRSVLFCSNDYSR